MRKRSSFLTRVSFFILFMLIFLLSSLFNRIDLVCLVSFDYAKIRSQISEALEGGEERREECPEHFRWIHEDLKPWSSTGISRDMLHSAAATNMSNFRLLILNGKPYLEKYKTCFATRDVFTLWGILQLLRLYPDSVPDLDLLFQCDDLTVVKKTSFPDHLPPPPPLFHYCGDDHSFDIVFPDWTFWGWAETNIRAWERTSKSIQDNNHRSQWKDRQPLAFWRGNTRVASTRHTLSHCNATDHYHSKAHIYSLQWDKETKRGRNNHTKLENQCDHRYKIYVEGRSWSVSEKYILACDSMALFIQPNYYDFFSRSLVPLHHYWPVSVKNMCQDITFAVEWGNSNPDKAEAIGKEGSSFVEQNLRMELVYDYMLHVLREYAKLLRFKVTVPEGAVQVSLETLTSMVNRKARKFLEDSKVQKPATDRPPCKMPPPFEPQQLHVLLHTKQSLIKQVEMEGNQYWKSRHINNKFEKRYVV
ncbi:uncharacterized protein LOC129291785 [Prosopis cineraria]|uniref:uncharacterized protein LOC129291785 n=1 Tax=Prosopis cineraria TaxID=364024 RepID=UPI00241094B3|nr:uncharacterized protein LOC129291785 [Prosopis cineraria]